MDKARGVGGRAATRRIDSQPVDHGIIFYHGSHPAFLAALDRVEPGTGRKHWPEIVVGEGSACLPRAFDSRERRVAFADGITAFPKSLARGLDLLLGSEVGSLMVRERHFTLDIGGAELETDRLVLALPAEQMQSLLEELPSTREVDGVRALTRTLTTAPCLTVIAGYPLTAPMPDWDVLYPSDSDILLASHDSRKRTEKKFHVLVLQMGAAFSRKHADAEPARWAETVLGETARLLGSWAEQPSFTQTHRWRFARANALPLSRPLVLRFPGGQTLGLAGEYFDPALGVEGAYLSGQALARRLLE